MTLEDLYRLLRSGHIQAQGVVDTLPEPLLVLDEGLNVSTANPAFLQTFKLERDDVVGQNLYRVGSGNWDTSELRRLISEVLPKSKAIVDYQITYDVPSGGQRILLLSAHRLIRSDNNGTNILLIFRDITEASRAAAAKDILLAESRHRMKNMMSVVRALMTQTKAEGRSGEEYRDALAGRFMALSNAQDLILADVDTISLEDLVGRTLALFPDQVRILPGPDVQLAHFQVLPLSFVLHELSTNAAKYGSLSAEEGVVEVSWNLNGQGSEPMLQLSWVEKGGPPVKRPDHTGFGSRLIEFSVTNDLAGTAEHRFGPEGYQAKIEIPLT
jgi:PAS domain S-box-containing protein